MFYYGVSAAVKLVTLFSFIYVAYWSMQSLNLQTLFRKNHSNQVQILLLFCAVALGYLMNEFFFEVISLTRNIVFPLK